MAPRFEIAQGVGGHTGSSLFVGGGGAFSFWPTPASFVALSLAVHGGPVPRDRLMGWRLVPSLVGGYLFLLGKTRLGPVASVSLPLTSVTIDDLGYESSTHRWLGFRGACGARFAAPTNRRVAFDLAAFIGIHTGKKEFVRADDTTFTILFTPLGEFYARVGLLVFL